MIPVVPLLLFLGPVSAALRRMSLFDRFFTWLFKRTRRRSRAFRRFGALGLALFVAIPLPITGAWTGSAAAFLLGVPFRTAFPFILLGVSVAGVVVTAAVLGGVSLGGLLFANH
jgi:uncharacterized membrane protein